MICATFRHRLPLWVEAEVPDPEAAAMAAHVAQCEGCRAAAEALRASQAWLKGAPEPFAESDREEVRRRVLGALQAEPAPRARSWALPLLAAAVVLGALALRPARPATASVPAPAPLQAALAKAPPDPVPATPAEAAPRPPRPRPREAAAVPEAAVARLEFQTSDPHIRIIWLARAQAPQPAPRPNEQEAP